MRTLKADKVPVTINEKQITEFQVRDMGFAELAATVQNIDDYANITRDLLRARMMKQITGIDAASGKHALALPNLMALPACYASPLQSMLEGGGAVGKILSNDKADGISAPVHYKLGVPIQLAKGEPITELEFLAKSYSSLEPVLLEDLPVVQALELIKGCAKPAGSKLMALPSWAIDMLSASDGLFIVARILPTFLSPDATLEAA